MEEKKEYSGFFSKFFHHGGAGIVASVVIILIFMMCATWLKSLIFGLLFAVILLPLERFFQDKVFRKERKSWYARLKEQITNKHLPLEEEKKKLKQARVFKSSLAALFSFVIIVYVSIYLAFAVLLPQAKKWKDAAVEWSRKNTTTLRVENQLLERDEGAKNRKGNFSIVKLKTSLKKFAHENKDKLTSIALSRGQDIVAMGFNLVRGMGTFLLDITLSIFFGFYFLQKLAMFEGSGKERRKRPGEWFVNLFYNSAWLPKVSQKTRWQTIRIITHVNGILIRWIRGYFTVIVIEFILYTLLFIAGGVPYPLLAGGVAGLTVLLPFIGPVVSFCLTIGLCIAFCETGLLMTLIIVTVIYCLINGLLEQFFLYPALIGEVSGLTTVETIIVVLIGGITAGISGMIFAVPTAAIIKYIIPEVYRASSWNTVESEKTKG